MKVTTKSIKKAKSIKKVGTKVKMSAIKRLISARPMGPGLMIVNSINSDNNLSFVARQSVENLIVNGIAVLSIELPDPDNVLSLYSGNYRKIEQAEFFDAECYSKLDSIEHMFEMCGSSDNFKWLTSEGFSLLVPIIDKTKGGMVTFEQKIELHLSPTEVDTLRRINFEAQQKGVWVVAFINCPKGCKDMGLVELCDDCIDVEECEVGPGQEIAFLINCVSLKNIRFLGHSMTMCSISDGQKIQCHYEPFISKSLKTRVMWRLRSQGMTLDRIGHKLDTDKATVSRRLKDLPKPYHVDVDENWVDECLELLDIGSSDNDSDDIESNGEYSDVFN